MSLRSRYRERGGCVVVRSVSRALIDPKRSLSPSPDTGRQTQITTEPRFRTDAHEVGTGTQGRAQRFVVLLIDIGVEVAHVRVAVDAPILGIDAGADPDRKPDLAEQSPRELIRCPLAIRVINLDVVDG